MKISVGDYWLTRNSQIVKVTEYNKKLSYPYCLEVIDTGGNYSVNESGNFLSSVESTYDLVKKVTPEKDPEYFI